MIIPYKVDVFVRRQPISNYLIIVLTAIVFALQPTCPKLFARVVCRGWSIGGLGGYMCMHLGTLHIVGNMLFLWVFGNPVCAKLGNVFYSLIYIALGIAAAIVHLIFDGRAVIGASGAINGVIGIYLVLWPLNYVKCLFIFIFVKRIRIAGLWVILWWFILNVLGAATGYTARAYFAHIGGFLSGIILAVILVRCRVIEKDNPEQVLFRSMKI